MAFPTRYGSQGKVDGRLVVILLFTGAFLLWGIVFFTGLHTRDARRGLGSRDGQAPTRDNSTHPDTLRAWLTGLPEEWIKVTEVEGQGLVILVPCYTSNSSLYLKGLKPPADSLPQVECEYCDSLGRYQVLGMGKDLNSGALDLQLNPPAGEIRVIPVTDTLLLRYPEAPFQKQVLLWTRPRTQGGSQGDSLTAPGVDTMVFVPASQENEFEVLRAEDENPEGCGPQGE